MEKELKFIGKVQSSLKNLEDCPRQENEDAPAGEILIFPEFAEGIKDIQAGSEVILFTWFHQSDRSVLSTHPRNDMSLPVTGVFSTRSPDRPNPIGIHMVKVLSNKGGVIKVDALEALDQTPIIDIKPNWKR